jgi:hypothetical protein
VNLLHRARQQVTGFLFPVGGDSWLSILRSGLGLQLVFYSISLRWDWIYLLAGKQTSFVGRDLSEALLSLDTILTPRLGWIVSIGSRLHLGENAVLAVIWTLLFFSGLCLIVGFYSRLASFLGWSLHLAAAQSAGLFSYGVDNFMTIGLFYLLISPLPDRKIRACSVSFAAFFNFISA